MDELLRMLDDERLAERAAARRRERALGQVAEETATLAGTLVDLAESGTAVTFRTADAGTHHGVLRLVGTDFCVLAGDAGEVWLTLRGVTTITARAGTADGDRRPAEVSFAEALARIAADRPRVQLVVAGGDRLAGVLRAVGDDVATVVLDGAAGAAYVSLPAVRLVLRSG